MAARDPQTGKFVSADEATRFLDLRGGQCTYTARINAADLSGQTAEAVFDDELIDFGDIIDDDEMFELMTLMVSYNFAFSVTSSGEMHASLYGFITRDDFDRGLATHANFASATNIGEDDIVERTRNRGRSDGVLIPFAAAADNGESDTTNGIGRGGMEQTGETVLLPTEALYGQGPMFDSTDELKTSYHFHVDQAANVGINFELAVAAQGRIHEI